MAVVHAHRSVRTKACHSVMAQELEGTESTLTQGQVFFSFSFMPKTSKLNHNAFCMCPIFSQFDLPTKNNVYARMASWCLYNALLCFQPCTGFEVALFWVYSVLRFVDQFYICTVHMYVMMDV